MEYYVVGQVVRLTHTVYGDDQTTLTDPATVQVVVSLPDGTSTGVLTPTRTSEGRFRYDYVTTQAGRHTFRWDTTSPSAPDDGSFDVRGAPQSILSLEKAKAALNKAQLDTGDDEELRGYLEAITTVIEDYTGLTIVRRSFTDRLTADWAGELWLHHRPVVSVTSIATLDGLITWPTTSADIDVHEDWGRLTLLRGSRWNGKLQVAYVAGMQVIGANIIEAAADILLDVWTPQRQPGIGPAPTPFDAGEPAPVASNVFLTRRSKELLGPPGVMVA